MAEPHKKENRANETSETGKAKADRWAYLKPAVIKERSPRVVIGFVTAGVVVTLMIVLMCSGGGAPPLVTHETPLAATNNYVLQENAARLEAHAEHANKNKNQNAMPAIRLPVFQVAPWYDGGSRQMRARWHQPTVMLQNKPPLTLNQVGTVSAVAGLVGKGAFAGFANSQATQSHTITATRIAHPTFTLVAGELIHATLESAINSELPGMVRAVVSWPVYAYAGSRPLIPAGSRLMGQYTAVPSNGGASTRVFVMWDRIITPQGISILINSPGTDSLGRAGMAANAVDHHFAAIFGSASLLSIMGAASANLGVSSSAQPNSADSYRQAVAQAFQQSAQTSLSQNLSIKPTLHIYQGAAINVFVAHDVDLYGVLHG